MIPYERIDPKLTGKKARQLDSSPGIQSGPTMLLPGQKPDGTYFREPLLVWQDIKPEVYAISAVLSDDIIDRGLEHHLTTSPEVLASALKKPAVDVFDNLVQYTKHSLHAALHEEKRLATSLWNHTHPRRKVWQRYLSLDKFLRAHVRLRNDSRNTLALERGLNTAITVMSNILRLIPQAYENHPDADNTNSLVTIAQNSYPIIVYLAMLDIYEFTREEVYLLNGNINLIERDPMPYDASKFGLRHANGGLGLEIKEHLSAPSKHKSTAPWAEPKIGCPAMINLGDGSAIRKLWDWHVQMAPVIFEAHLKSK